MRAQASRALFARVVRERVGFALRCVALCAWVRFPYLLCVLSRCILSLSSVFPV